jgi:aminopeptidase N
MRTRCHLSVIALAAALSSVRTPMLQAQDLTTLLSANAERMSEDLYSRSHDYHLVHQHITVRDFSWDSTSFTGTVATTLVALRPAFDSVILDAGALLTIRRVTSTTGSVRYTRHGDTLVVHLPQPVAFDDTVRFTIDYDGRVKSGNGLTFIDERSHTPRQIWSQGETNSNHDWFPTYDFPNDKMTWEVEATVPPGFTAVSNGTLLTDTKDAAGNRTMHWSQEKPSATYLVSLVVAPLVKIHDSWHGVPVDYYVYKEDSALAYPLFHMTPDVIDVYSALTGVPYPWAKYAQTTVADFFGGMENVSATTLVDWLPDPAAYQDHPWYKYVLIPHELSHQWFGDYVTLQNWANMWLNEGFATFMPGQYWGHRTGAHAEEDYYFDQYNDFMSTDRKRMPLAAMGSNNIYPKGALVLEMLQQYLGPDRFWAGVHHYLTLHAFGNANSDDLRQAFFEATGENLDWFWNEWVYAAGYPDFTVTNSYDAPSHRLTLTVNQTQRDTLRADSTGLRYIVPEAFRMPVTIRVGTARGDVVRHGWIRQRADTIVVDSVLSAPTMVIFDDGNHILKTLHMSEPAEWLANQLHHDPDLWNRNWVIEQLADKRGDTTASAALRWAATNADYPLTRAQAIAALVTFPANAILPVLDRAAHDTSAQVRQAAVEAFGDIGGPHALDVVQAAWTSDSSGMVRAAALQATARINDAIRVALITQGLSTPSYQDVIQNAALSLAVRFADPSLDAKVQQIVGDNPNATQILAVLAQRDDALALTLLVTDLDDPRQWVRKWTLAAFSSRIEPARAISILQGAEPKLTHPDARQEVARLIDQLRQRSR